MRGGQGPLPRVSSGRLCSVHLLLAQPISVGTRENQEWGVISGWAQAGFCPGPQILELPPRNTQSKRRVQGKLSGQGGILPLATTLPCSEIHQVCSLPAQPCLRLPPATELSSWWPHHRSATSLTAFPPSPNPTHMHH